MAFVDDGLVVPGTGGTFCLTWCYGPNGFIVTTTGGLAGPSAHIENHILSPVLTLPAGAGEGVLLAFDEYVHEDLSADAPGIFSMWGVRSADTDGSDGPPQVLADQAFSYDGLLGYGRASYRRREVDLTSRLGPGADEIQVRLGVLELGWMWGWTGDDGYPAPYFDNVAVKVFPYAGPAMSALEHQLAGDAFPEQDALTYGDPGAMNVRFDMAARSLSPLGTVPRDSIVAEVVPRRAGSVLLGPPQLHYLIDANPTFDPYRTTPTSGAVDGWPVTSAGGTAIAGAWAFDLPDTGTLYPGDVLHYYIRARDDVAGDVAVATLPADLAGFGDFSQPAAYDRRFTVDALPGIRDESGTGAWTAPKFLYWDDGGSAAAHDTWLAAIEEAGFDAYDVFVTASASSNLLSGLGAATSGACLAPYEAIVYSSGTLYETIGDGDATFGHGSDIAALEIYLAGGNRGLLVTGDEMASDLAWDRGAAGAAFLADVVGLEVLAGDLRPFISGQVVPQVGVIPGNPALGLLDAWVAYGGCPALNTFDAVEVRPGTDRLAEFLDPAGNGGVYTYAAAAARLSVNGNVVASLPYDLAFVYTSQEWPPVPYRNARSLLLEDLLRYMSVLPPECPNGDCPPVPDLPAFAVHCAPNPFNPATRLSYTVPASGHLSLKIYDLRGRLVRTVLDEQVTADGSVVWDGRDADGAAVASGVYFTEARLNGEVRVGKVALIK